MKFILILFGLLGLCTYNPKDIRGAYYDTRDNGYNVVITSDRFYYIEPGAGWCNDTLAEFAWQRLNEQFIKISQPSPDYFSVTFKNMNVAVSNDSCISSDSMKIVFSIPYTKSDLIIEVGGVKGKIAYSENKREFVLPKPQHGHISSISIDALREIRAHDSDGKFYGLSYFIVDMAYHESWIGKNYYEITIPLDNTYFEKYYTDGEFVRVHNDTLTWKGRTFVKSE